MEQYTKEWFTFHLLKMRDTFWSTDGRMWDELPDLIRKIGDAVAKITGMGREGVASLVADKLMDSETERQAFFRRYDIPSASDNICLQMQTSA